MHSGGGCPGPSSSQTSRRGPRWPLGPALPPRRNPAASQSHAPCLPPNPLTSCPFSLGGLSYSLRCSQFRGSFLLSIQFHPSFKSTRKEMERWPVQGTSMGVEHLTTWSFLPKTRGRGTAATNNPQETLPMGLTSYCKTKQHTQHECAARCWSRSRKWTHVLLLPRGEGELGDPGESRTQSGRGGGCPLHRPSSPARCHPLCM